MPEDLFLSTDLIEPELRSDYWRAIMRPLFDAEPGGDDDGGLVGSLRWRLCATLLIGHTWFNSQFYRRDRQVVRRSRLDDFYLVEAVDTGQWEAGRAIGMRRGKIFRRIVLPQAIQVMIPSFINQTILQLKNTSLVSVVAVGDLLYQGSVITAASYRPLEVYTVIAVIYFLVLFPLTLVADRVEQRLGAHR